MWGYEAVTATSTDIPANASVIPTKLPTTGIAWQMSHATVAGTTYD